MIQTRYKLLNWISMAAMLVFLCGLQTSFWHQVTGGAPAPQLWLLVFLYLVLFRTYFQAMASVYFLSIFLKAFSAIPLGILWPVLLFLISPSYYFKRRMFWPSTKYFIIASAIFTTGFHLIFFITSRILESNPTPLLFFTRLTEVGLTALFAGPIYWILCFIDRVTMPALLETQEAKE